MPFTSSKERKRCLPRYLAIYNGRRCHMALAGRTPFQQLQRLRVTEWPGEKTHLNLIRITNQPSQGPGGDGMKAGARGEKAPKSRLIAIPSAEAMLVASPLLAVILIDTTQVTTIERAKPLVSHAFSVSC
jgi:hypothetical protein